MTERHLHNSSNSSFLQFYFLFLHNLLFCNHRLFRHLFFIIKPSIAVIKYIKRLLMIIIKLFFLIANYSANNKIVSTLTKCELFVCNPFHPFRANFFFELLVCLHPFYLSFF